MQICTFHFVMIWLYHILEILALIQHMVNPSWTFTKQNLVPEKKDMFTKRIREDSSHSHPETRTHPLQIAQETKNWNWNEWKQQDIETETSRNSKSHFLHTVFGASMHRSPCDFHSSRLLLSLPVWNKTLTGLCDCKR
jgi:hypothetical protein